MKLLPITDADRIAAAKVCIPHLIVPLLVSLSSRLTNQSQSNIRDGTKARVWYRGKEELSTLAAFHEHKLNAWFCFPHTKDNKQTRCCILEGVHTNIFAGQVYTPNKD